MRARGMTLVELLIAFALTVVMVLSLMAFASATMAQWRHGERRKDTYDRAMRILTKIESDLRSAHRDPRVPTRNGRPLLAAQLRCEAGPAGAPLLRFVRSVPEPDDGPGAFYGNLREVSYTLDPQSGLLWRRERPFDRFGGRGSIFAAGFERRAPKTQDGWEVLESGVLWLEFAFSAAGEPPERNGWDSLVRPPRRGRPPRFALPRAVRVTLEVESHTTDLAPVRLAAPLSATARTIEVTQAELLPDPPALVRIEGEWIAYDAKGTTSVGVARRGARGTSPASHQVGSPVRFGARFETLIDIPAGGLDP